jgi:hypothetical protein
VILIRPVLYKVPLPVCEPNIIHGFRHFHVISFEVSICYNRSSESPPGMKYKVQTDVIYFV